MPLKKHHLPLQGLFSPLTTLDRRNGTEGLLDTAGPIDQWLLTPWRLPDQPGRYRSPHPYLSLQDLLWLANLRASRLLSTTAPETRQTALAQLLTLTPEELALELQGFSAEAERREASRVLASLAKG